MRVHIYLLMIVLLATLRAGAEAPDRYVVGIGDTLEIQILQPDRHSSNATVSPDGFISVIYIGNVRVQGKSIAAIRRIIEQRLSDGYLQYPVVSVTLVQSRSLRFTVTGEVNRPGTYLLEEETTVLKAISIAGGFTRFGSSSSVRILRPRKKGHGYEKIPVNIKKVMNGDAEADALLHAGDIVVVSEGLF